MQLCFLNSTAIIILQVLYIGTHPYPTDIHVLSPDTDVYTFLMDLVSHDRLSTKHHLHMYNKSKTHPIIDIKCNVRRLGKRKSQALIGLQELTGSDWGGKFVGNQKLTWCKRFLALDDDDPIITALINLGKSSIPMSLTDDGELPEELRPLERFVCMAYCTTLVPAPEYPLTIPKLRWHLFRTKNAEGENLPPTRGVLLPHITRANYIAMRDKSYTERSVYFSLFVSRKKL